MCLNVLLFLELGTNFPQSSFGGKPVFRFDHAPSIVPVVKRSCGGQGRNAAVKCSIELIITFSVTCN